MKQIIKQSVMHHGKKIKMNREYGDPKNNNLWSYPDDETIEYDNVLDLRLWKDNKGRKVFSIYVAGNTDDPVEHYRLIDLYRDE